MLSSKNGRSMGWLAGITAAGVLLGACAAQTAQAANPGAVTLNPASGAISGKPTWSTAAACPTGFQGSAVFRAVKADGTTFSISQATNSVTAAFSGTLQAPIAAIKSLAGIPNGGTQKFEIICFSKQSLTGTSQPEMTTFVTYSADGTSYTSKATAPQALGSSSPTARATAPAAPAAQSSSPSSSGSPTPAASSPSPASSGSSGSSAPAPTPVNSDLAVTG
jgi:hypothetical protein